MIHARHFPHVVVTAIVSCPVFEPEKFARVSTAKIRESGKVDLMFGAPGRPAVWLAARRSQVLRAIRRRGERKRPDRATLGWRRSRQDGTVDAAANCCL
jgi:hypothetical protein